MSKKKTPVSSHPAARSADTDLVRLTREFESITAELKRLDDTIEEHRASQRAARIDFEMGYAYNDKKIDHCRRQQRTLNAQLANVRELISPLTQNTGDCAGRLSATEVGAMQYVRHPLFNPSGLTD